MEDQDLLEIGILNSGHRQRILQAIQLLPKVSHVLFSWPYAVVLNPDIQGVFIFGTICLHSDTIPQSRS